jgi:tripartite-type tricarboxylate transporter receptor subunit TctC
MDAPWKAWNELIAYASADPGKVPYATPGAGPPLWPEFTMEP